LIKEFAVKTFEWEVSSLAMETILVVLEHLSFFEVIKEMMMRKSSIVEEVYKYNFVVYEAASDVRIRHVVNDLCLVIDPTYLIYINLFFLD
jgi:hypothetical protein